MARVARDSAAVAVGTLVSRLTGLVRVIVTAAVLGPTFFGNVFQATNLLPHLTYSALAGSMVSALLVPPLVKARDSGDTDGAARLAGGILGTMLVGTALVGSIVVVSSPVLVRPLVASLPGEVDAAAARHVALVLLIIVVPQVVLLALAGVGVAVQNSRDRFGLAAMAPLFENVGVMITMVASAVLFGTGMEVEAVTDPQLVFLAGGTTASVGLHAAMQWWGAHRAGITIRPRAGWRDPEVRAIFRLVPASVGTTAITTGRYLGVALAAGRIQGGTVAFQMALNFYHLPVALASSPMGVAVMPRLARLARLARPRQFMAVYNDALRLTWFLVVPAAVGVVVLAPSIASAVTFGEMDSPRGERLVALSLAALGFAVVGEGTLEVTRRASYAIRNARLPFQAMVIRAVVTVVGLTVAFRLDGERVLVALGLTFAVGDLLSAFWLDGRLRQRLEGSQGRSMAFHLFRMALTSVVVVPAALLTAGLVERAAPSPLRSTAPIVAAGLLGVFSYGLLHHLLRSRELTDLVSLLQRRAPVPDPAGRIGGSGPVELDEAEPESAPEPVSAPAPDVAPGPRPVPVARLHGARTPGFAWSVVPVTVVALVGALGTGAVVGRFGLTGGGVVFGVIALVITAVHPEWAVYAYVGLLPFLAGMPRGDVIPLLRPTEILQTFLTVGVLGGVVVRLFDGRPVSAVWTRVETSFLLFACTASVLPVVWLMARGLPVTVDDLLATIPIWKYFALFVLVRGSVTTPAQVRRCLVISVAVAVVTGLVATFQALNLFGAPALVSTLWRPEGTSLSDLSGGRGSGFLGSPIATVTFVTYNLGIALALWINDRRTRLWAGAAAAALTVSSFGIGQITGILALVIVALTLGALTGRLGQITRAGALVIPLAVLLVWPVLGERFATTYQSTWVPESWVVRWDNLTTFYWAHMGEFNWVLGVRPDSIVEAPETWRDVIFLESGYTWLLWVGGVPLLLAFFWFTRTALTALVAVLEERTDAVGSAALSAAVALLSILLLATIDMHITTRGEADLAYVLLALALAVPTRALMAASYNQGEVG